MIVRALALAAAGVAAAAGAAAAPAHTGAASSPVRITAAGVGKVKLGARYSALRDAGLVGRLRAGCTLGGRGARVARLRAPLKGQVDLTRSRPRRVRAITVTGGATARGVRIGDAIEDVVAAYPKAKVDHSQEDRLEATFARVPKKGGGRLTFLLPIDKKTVT